MNLVGKILVVLQLVLSIFFMAFAGVVYNAQTVWRAEAIKEKANVVKATKERDDTRSDLDRTKTEMEAKVKAAETKAAALEADKAALTADTERLKKELGDVAVNRKTASEQALIAGEEAAARIEESLNLRQINYDQSKARDAEFDVRLKLEDQVHGLQIDLDAAKQKNRKLLSQVSILQQALEAAGLSSDITELAGRASPPPRVEGIIEEILPPKRQGASELVEISLGSDQGLKTGHEMTVYRTGLKGGQQPRFLAKIKIVNTKPDKAVGQVIEGSRNGVIKKGDNVTTKL